MVKREKFYAGFGMQDFTPEETDKGGFKVYDPIFFSALILKMKKTNVTFLAGDFFSIQESLLDLVRERIADIDWLNFEHILPCAAHIGTAPILYESYVRQKCSSLRCFDKRDFFADQMAAAIRKAAIALRPARIGMGSQSAPKVHYNRRSYNELGNLVMSNFLFPYPRPELKYGDVDDNVYVIRVDNSDGEPVACAYVFGCHALCSTDKGGNISADYPGVVRRLLSAAGIEALFLPGSIGDVVPISRAGRSAERVGRSVAGTALCALEHTETSACGTLNVKQKTLRLPVSREISVKDQELFAKLTSDKLAGLTRFLEYHKCRRANGKTSLQYKITRISINENYIIHLPGEIFVETAKAIKEAGGDRLIAVLSGPTADVGYLSTAQALEEGGMEPLYAGLAEGTEALIREAACNLVGE